MTDADFDQLAAIGGSFLLFFVLGFIATKIIVFATGGKAKRQQLEEEARRLRHARELWNREHPNDQY